MRSPNPEYKISDHPIEVELFHIKITIYRLIFIPQFQPLGQMLCYSAEENQQEYCHISYVDDHKAEL